MNWTQPDIDALTPELYDELITWISEQQPKAED